MKTVFVAPRFYPVCGGYEWYVRQVATSLAHAGRPVEVFTTNAYDLEYFWLPQHRAVEAATERLDGITITRLLIAHRKWRRRAGRLLSYLPSTALRARYAAPSFLVPQLRGALARAAFEQVHVGPLPYNALMWEGIQAARARRARVVATPATHLGPEDDPVVRRHYLRPFQIDLLNQCDTVLVATNAERGWLARHGVQEEKLQRYCLGIKPESVQQGNAARFREQHRIEEPIVLFLGAKAYEKGAMHLVEAIERLWADGLHARLVLAGASLSEFESFRRARPSWSAEHTLDLGVVSDAEKGDLLAAAALLALPSRVESFGLVYLEAWANRKPVIGARTPATAEVIAHGSNGLLVEFGDTGSLTEALARLLTDARLRQEMGEAGYNKVINEHTWSRCWSTLAKHFGVDPTP
ncbi:MAG TPA: glycosyltransferase family 4 protein [Candidatus Xenobia bacterium]|nr:glycosyltransferase family 4 protein [Candidatus Xenobia bacterium]